MPILHSVVAKASWKRHWVCEWLTFCDKAAETFEFKYVCPIPIFTFVASADGCDVYLQGGGFQVVVLPLRVWLCERLPVLQNALHMGLQMVGAHGVCTPNVPGRGASIPLDWQVWVASLGRALHGHQRAGPGGGRKAVEVAHGVQI